MERPKKAHANIDRGTSTLYFEDEVQTREYYMVGGICWPFMYQVDDKPTDVMGYAIMAGQDIETRVVHIFEHREFVAVDHIFGPNNLILYHGIAPFFNQVWANYYARRFYFNQPDEMSKRYHLEVIRSPMIAPKPAIIEIPLPDPMSALSSVWQHIKTKTVQIPRGTILAEHIKLNKTNKVILPAVQALACLLVGLDRFPYRRAA